MDEFVLFFGRSYGSTILFRNLLTFSQTSNSKSSNSHKPYHVSTDSVVIRLVRIASNNFHIQVLVCSDSRKVEAVMWSSVRSGDMRTGELRPEWQVPVTPRPKTKDLYRNGRNTQIFNYKGGGEGNQKPICIALLRRNIFFWKKVWKYFPKHKKAEGMT